MSNLILIQSSEKSNVFENMQKVILKIFFYISENIINIQTNIIKFQKT